MLAGLVQAPSRLAPNRNPDAAQARAELVIAAMNDARLHHARHDQDGAWRARQTGRAPGAGSVNYAADYVMDVLDDFVGTVEIRHRRVDDPRPRPAERRRALPRRCARRTGREIQREPGRHSSPCSRTAPSRRWWAAAITRRASSTAPPRRAAPAGSSFKPFVYLAAMERGAYPQHGAGGFAGQLQRLVAEELRSRLSRRHHAARRAGALAQHRGGKARHRGRGRKRWSRRPRSSGSIRRSSRCRRWRSASRRSRRSRW